jgi:hypothetical protein
MRIQTFIAAGGAGRGKGGVGVKDLYSELINLRFVEDINCSSARRHEGGVGGPFFYLLCATFSNAVSMIGLLIDDTVGHVWFEGAAVQSRETEQNHGRYRSE